jgi:hypothetical protein
MQKIIVPMGLGWDLVYVQPKVSDLQNPKLFASQDGVARAVAVVFDEFGKVAVRPNAQLNVRRTSVMLVQKRFQAFLRQMRRHFRLASFLRV